MDWTFEKCDDGWTYSVASYSGGASEYGVMGELSLMREHEDGRIEFRRYRAQSEWCDPEVIEVEACEPVNQ